MKMENVPLDGNSQEKPSEEPQISPNTPPEQSWGEYTAAWGQYLESFFWNSEKTPKPSEGSQPSPLMANSFVQKNARVSSLDLSPTHSASDETPKISYAAALKKSLKN